MWLGIHGGFRLFILKVITIYVICIALFKGIQVLFNLGSLGMRELVICFIASWFVLFILNMYSKEN